MGYQIQLSDEAVGLIKRLGMPAYVLRAVAAALDLENSFTLANIVEKHLTGKGPYPVDQHRLGERSHMYRKSVRAAKSEVSGGSVVGSIGANVVYAGVHEEGFQGEVSVKGHFRSRTVLLDFKRLGKRIRKKTKVRDVSVWGHTRKMNIPARKPLHTGVEERIDQYGPAISQAIINAFDQGKP